MSGSRSKLALALALLALAFAAPAARAKTFGGVVPDTASRASDVGARNHAPRLRTARIANLPYGGGPVLHSNRTHLIFWQPTGSSLGFEPGYESTIEFFLASVAADSRKPTNVYGLSGQYSDSGGPAAYDSTYGGAVVATDRLPANHCVEPLVTGPGWPVCLSDAQLENEISKVIAADHLPTTALDIYFLVTPKGVGSCQTTGPEDCALGGDISGYCGYHSSSADGTILYAVIPYNAVFGHCQSDNPRPNSSAADPTLSTLSHEHNEIVTDPLGTAWIDGSFSENGDLCISSFGPNVGGSGSGAWNEVIHGAHYYLQEEWSNENWSCQPRDESDPISFSAPARAQTRKSLRLVAHARDFDGAIVAYRWFFDDGRAAHGNVVSHAFTRAGSYRVVLRTTDRAGNWAFSALTVSVSKALARNVKRRAGKRRR